MKTRATVFDVAQYIRDKYDEISTIKIQKLVYYAKAWSLVWDEDPLFEEDIEAWANGPVIPDLYQVHKGLFFCPEEIPNADLSRLTDNQKESIDIVLKTYGNSSPQYLVALTHTEEPWIIARGNTPSGEPSRNKITDEMIANYYCRIYEEDVEKDESKENIKA